ncbi:Agenet domain-containing protein [Abeliophyllum distichum]|uniref:Agenet domain-containing protein n=1 Tax=Abeliophyllum distichum TaxID=126358 RepID=A0ABD1PPG3_9LAMI
MAGNVDANADPFKKGTQVEVSLEDDGFRGPWYTATIVHPISKKTHKIHLEFHTLTSGDNSAKPLREAVDPILVRPILPREARRQFNVSENFDDFHNDSWWEGIVITALDDGRYSVFFRSCREQIEFNKSQLRLHREWVYGKWTKVWKFCLPFSLAFFGEL